MAQRLFREYIALFKDWPIDATKTGRCLGEHLRGKFNQDFSRGELSENVDEARWNKMLKDLRPIANNEYATKYARMRSTAALNLSKEQCKLTMSNQAIKFMNDNNLNR